METINVYNLDFEHLDLINHRGKEADIFSDYKTVYKIYKSRYIDLDLKNIKLELLSELSLKGLIIPKKKLVNPYLAGFTMDYVAGKEIGEVSFTTSQMITLFKTISNLLKVYHANKIILGDINKSNILIKTPEEIYFCDVDSCSIEGFECDSIPFITYKFLKFLGIDHKIIEIDEDFDNLSVFLLFLYILLDKQYFWTLTDYDLDKKLEDKQLSRQFVKTFKRKLIKVPYIGDML